ncbi:MAG TPA: hydrogenase maturation nickel metallochaperone HypA [Nitrospiraceae bacterium]|nr:hydrogenase maturation nickel metallochaperone HypA [Nitrospiraceae bacterium]
MHELNLIRHIVAIVNERANGANVAQVTLEVGKLNEATPETIRFGFDLATKGTLLECARLEIVEISGLGRCRACGQDVPMNQLVERCSCGSTDLERLAGHELTITHMVTV